MKKIYSLLFLLLCFTSHGGHEIGSMIITYKPVPNQPLKYTVTVVGSFAGPGSGAINPPSAVTLSVTSPCFSNQTVNLPRVRSTGAAVVPLGASYCFSGYSNNYTGLVEFESVVTLPSHCSVVTMSVNAGLGRFDPMQNIVSNYDVPYFYVKLYNTATLGTNNSPAVQAVDLDQFVCTNKSVNLYGFTEADGDSLHFIKTTPLKGVSQTYNWATGYNQQYPLGGGSSYTLNNSNGAAQISLPNAGMYLIPMKYYEYRYDTSTSAMSLVGEGIYSFVINGTNACSAPTNIGIQYETAVGADSVACGTNKIRLKGTRQLSRGSITPQGSEFEVVSNKSGNMGIASATLIQDSIIELVLSQVPPLNDTLRLVAKDGTDSNVVISRCGVELTAYEDTLTYYTPAGVQPIANGTLGNSFLNAQFNSTTSIGDSIWWDFGDGNGSDLNTGNHSYSGPGTYNVTLTAFGACGSIDDTTYLLQVCDSISAVFTYAQSGDTVYFSVGLNSSGASYHWNFGDGSSGMGNSVSHVYAQGVGYLAELIVTNLCGDTALFSDSITTCIEPVPSWTYTVISTTSSGMTVDFDGTASTNVSSFEWDFGDGTTNNTSLTPRHLYQTPGLHYYVKLTVENNCQQLRVKGFRMDEIGVAEHKLRPLFELYPNPVNDKIKLKWFDQASSITAVTIYNVSGVEVCHFEIAEIEKANPLEVPVLNLPKGTYVIRIETNKGDELEEVFIKN